MGTCTWTTADAPGKIIADEFAPYLVRMWTTGNEAAAVCIVVPVTDENRDDLARLYDFPADARAVYVASIIKHEGTLSRRHTPGMVRGVSIKHMSEDMGPNYTGGATPSFFKILTPLKPKPAQERDNLSLTWAHNWRARAMRAAMAAA